MKQAILWFTQRKDIYFGAWQAWVLRGSTRDWPGGVTPCRETKRRPKCPGDSLQQLLGPLLCPSLPAQEGEQQQYTCALTSLTSEAISWTTPEEWVVELSRPLLPLPPAMTPADAAFWPTYSWADNPWIMDQQGNVLTARQYDKIQPCAIADLHVQRIGVRTYSFVIPTVGATTHQQAKLRRWGIAILLSAPCLGIGERLGVRPTLVPRHPPHLTHDYVWESVVTGHIRGVVIATAPGQRGVIELEQQSNGIHWTLAATNTEDRYTEADCQQLRRAQDAGGIVFQAHPLLHGLPWSVPDSVANRHVLLAIKKQAFQRCKGSEYSLRPTLQGLRVAAQESAWQYAALQQTPRAVWDHGRAHGVSSMGRVSSSRTAIKSLPCRT